MQSLRTAFIVAMLALLPGLSPNDAPSRPLSGAVAPFDGTVSVLTYNVKGLPWPVATGRGEAFERISARLRDLRGQGRNPHIVVLQEAFTRDARHIGRDAGYRYIVDGPSAADMIAAPMSAGDRAFAAGASWRKGETEGKYVDSGLQLLSDYPVLRVRRIAYPAFACAGYDCLASKGALLVTVRLPGAAELVDVVTTHLNSRHASGVSDDRSLYAYRRQLGFLAAFIRTAHDPRYPLVVSGDFNVGAAPMRRAALLRDAARSWTQGAALDALHQVARMSPERLPIDAGRALARARDWQFFAAGTRMRLAPLAISVPFGREAGGTMLSDHIGYVARFRLTDLVATRHSPMTG